MSEFIIEFNDEDLNRRLSWPSNWVFDSDHYQNSFGNTLMVEKLLYGLNTLWLEWSDWYVTTHRPYPNCHIMKNASQVLCVLRQVAS